jgi:hypothetical protein
LACHRRPPLRHHRRRRWPPFSSGLFGVKQWEANEFRVLLDQVLLN